MSEPTTRRISYSQAINEALNEEMERDPSLLLLGEDVAEAGGVFGVTKDLYKKFGTSRVLDTPIAEEALVGAALGASLLGVPTVTEIMFSDFVTLAMDQLVNQAAKFHYMTGGRTSVPMLIRMVTGTAGAAAAQHSQSLEAWFTHTPGLKVVTASTPYEAKGLLKSAIRDPDPVLFFEHKLLYNSKGEVPEEEYTLPLGEGAVMREGTDVTVVTYLNMLPKVLQAAKKLDREGISVEVWNPRSLTPFDREGLGRAICKTGRLLIVYEAPQRSGFGAEIAAIAAEDYFQHLKAPVCRLGGANTPMPYAPEMENRVVPGVEDIMEAVRKVAN